MQPAYEGDNGGIRRHTQRAPCHLATGQRAERRSRWHYHVLGGPADPGGQQVITDLGAHRDQPVGVPGEGAFHHNQTASRQAGEIAMKQMPVKGMKAGRNTGHHGRETPGNTGLRGVQCARYAAGTSAFRDTMNPSARASSPSLTRRLRDGTR